LQKKGDLNNDLLQNCAIVFYGHANLMALNTINIFSRSPFICTIMGLIICFSAAKTFANDLVIAYTDEQMWEWANDTYLLTQNTIEKEETIFAAAQILGQSCNINVVVPNNSEDLLQEARYWEKNYGFELRGGLTSGDLDDSEIDGGGVSYLELSWDVLDNGYKEFDYKAQDLKRRAELEKISAQLEEIANRYRCRGYQIGKSFVGIEAKIATAKLVLMESVYKIEQEAYFDGGSDFDEFLVSEEALFTLRRRLEELNAPHNYEQAAFDVRNLPAFDINIEKVLQSIAADPRFRSVVDLQQQRIATSNPYQDGKRLRLFVRKEFDILSSNRDDLVAGLRFAVPLVFADKPNYQNKLRQLEADRSLDEWERVTRVRQVYQSFRQQTERVISQNYRYLRSKERMRRVFSRKAMGDPLVLQAVIARLVNYVDTSLELIAVKQGLFERANALFLTSRMDFSPEYIRPLPMSIENYRARPYSRGVYVWSAAFNRLSNEQLLLLLQTKSFTRVMLSYSKMSDKEKLTEFVQSAKERGVEIEFMLSDNQWVYERNHLNAAKTVAALTTQTEHIHLDIEPQALDSYSDNKAQYQESFIAMLKAIRQQSPDIYLSISVPFHWELETYIDAEALTDNIVVMNYENDNVDTLVRRMKRIRQVVPKTKIAMAVRPKDFPSNFALEETLRLVNKATGVDEFVMHKLADLVNE
jgi:hypothetical protein